MPEEKFAKEMSLKPYTVPLATEHRTGLRSTSMIEGQCTWETFRNKESSHIWSQEPKRRVSLTSPRNTTSSDGDFKFF